MINELKKTIDETERMAVSRFRMSESEYAFPLVVPKKKD